MKSEVILLVVLVAISFIMPLKLSEAASFSESLSESLSVSDTITLSSPKFYFGGFGVPLISYADASGFASNFASGIPQVPVQIFYDDSINPKWADGVIDNIQVQVSSSITGATTSLTLVEVDPGTCLPYCTPTAGTGIFANDNLVFMNGNNLFSLDRTATVTVSDPSAIGTIPVAVFSNSSFAISDPGISLVFSETGVSTGIFTGDIGFTSGPSSGKFVHAVQGDVVTVAAEPTTNDVISNALITPNPRSDASAIQTIAGDTITASYGSLSTSVSIVAQVGEPGGGGGGLVTTPGLVLDALASLLSIGGGPTSSPPSFSLQPSITNSGLPEIIKDIIKNPSPYKVIPPITGSTLDLPLSINNNGYVLPLPADTILTNTLGTGTPVKLKVVMHDPYEVVHLSLFTNLRGQSRNIIDSDTAIIYDKGKPPLIKDPHGFFSNVKVSESQNGDRYEFDYGITFAKPMDTSDIIFRGWNSLLSSSDLDILNAWKIASSPTNNNIQPQTNPSSTSQNVQAISSNLPLPQTETIDQMTSVKEWAGYSPTSISDSALLKVFGMQGQHIPSWFMKSTKWLVDGETSKQEFVDALKYMKNEGIIK